MRTDVETVTDSKRRNGASMSRLTKKALTKHNNVMSNAGMAKDPKYCLTEK
jgi:hypothetical protein